jgi:anti-repressor protein
MNELEVFKNSEFGEVRVVMKEDEPWFVGKDVATILGYTNPRKAMIDHVDDEDKDGVTIRDTLNREQKVVGINESGLYSLILRSKLPSAKKFKRWVTSEVLPAIRKHGGYLTEEKIEEALLNPDVLIQLATNLKEEKEKRLKAENKLIEVKPKVEFAEAIIASEDSIKLGDYAKVISKRLNYKIGRNILFRLLRDNQILMRDNIPYQTYIDKGYFEVREILYYKGTKMCNGLQTMVTGLGQERLFHMVKNIIETLKDK